MTISAALFDAGMRDKVGIYPNCEDIHMTVLLDFSKYKIDVGSIADIGFAVGRAARVPSFLAGGGDFYVMSGDGTRDAPGHSAYWHYWTLATLFEIRDNATEYGLVLRSTLANLTRAFSNLCGISIPVATTADMICNSRKIGSMRDACDKLLGGYSRPCPQCSIGSAYECVVSILSSK